MKDYKKPPLKYPEQLALLKKRGLLVKNEKNALQFLGHVSYYRLSAYFLPFEEERHLFNKEVDFSSIKSLYEFDRELRSLLGEALEVIEIQLRTSISNCLVHKYDAFLHENENIFFKSKKFNYSDWLDNIHNETKRSREVFIKHYKQKYNGFPALPFWMALEVMSFGSLSVLVNNLIKKDKSNISSKYSLHPKVFCSWLHTFTYIRNICAHHGRVWDRVPAIKLLVPKDKSWKGINENSIASVIFAILHFLKVQKFDDKEIDNWRERFDCLISKTIPGLEKSYHFSQLKKINQNHLWSR